MYPEIDFPLEDKRVDDLNKRIENVLKKLDETSKKLDEADKKYQALQTWCLANCRPTPF